MRVFSRQIITVALIAAATLLGCTSSPTKSVDVTESLRKSLDQMGLKDVKVSQDREKGVVTLGGHVATEADKARAEMIARPIATGQVVALEIAVVPEGVEKEAKAINTDIDKGIEKNVDAALIAAKLKDSVKHEVKNAVVTLSGEVESQARRSVAESVAIAVPYVKQVVNTVQVKDQKATSTKY